MLRFLGLSLLSFVLAFNAGAQQRVRTAPPSAMVDSAGEQILALLRRQDSASVRRWSSARDVLRQYGRPQPDSKINLIGDELVRIAVSARAQNEIAHSNAGAALRLLCSSGITTAEEPTAVPYAGAIDRLIRINREAADSIIGGTVLSCLTQQPDRPRGLAYLREVAVTNRFAAVAAIMALTDESLMGGQYEPDPSRAKAEALSILRELFDGELVVHCLARKDLELFGRMRGWRREGSR